MMWALELEYDFARWRALTGAPDDESERKRWVKMCHRLGSHQAYEIVVARQARIDKMSKRNSTR